MRSCDRDASLAKALISVVMTLGAGHTVPFGGVDEVISNSTASKDSKQEVMSFTEHRESHDTDRYSPSTHTWQPRETLLQCPMLTFHCRATCLNTWENRCWDLRNSHAAVFWLVSKIHRKEISCNRHELQLHYHVSVDFLFAVDVGCGAGELQELMRLVHHQGRVELAQLQQVATEHPTWKGGESEDSRGENMQQRNMLTPLCVNLRMSLMYLGMLRRRLLLSKITKIKWANSCSSATWKTQRSICKSNLHVLIYS